ncbi:hypothetical protein CGRA01v4_07502 [Colletotrichum graminicola]|nr:hypothetical protein CGRA01v4_07502 [Colletotrichum graminicola]
MPMPTPHAHGRFLSACHFPAAPVSGLVRSPSRL